MEQIWNSIASWAMNTGIKIVIALVILLIAFRVINVVARKIEKKMEGKADKTLLKVLVYTGKVLAKIVVVMGLVGYLGIDTSGLAALIASLGVAVGLAVNGALANLAGGVLILVTRPFKIGDYISAQGAEGTVEDIRIVSTKLVTVDNKVVYLPNGALSAGNIVNFSEKDIRRVDLDFSVAGNDPAMVKALVLETANKDERILKDPAAQVLMTGYGAGKGTTVTVRAWTKSGDYWAVYMGLLDAVRVAFEEKGVVIPFNQLDVHIRND